MFQSVRFVGLAWLLLAWAGGAARADGSLYFADVFYPTFDDGAIRRVNTDGTGLETLVSTGGGLRGLAPNSDANWMYWSNVDSQVIARTHLDGSGPETIISSGLSFANALALDNAANRLFWGDQTAQQIGHANLDGSGAGLCLTTAFHTGLAVDTLGDKLYWTRYCGPTTGAIMRANFDGSGAETVLSDFGKPANLALDPAGGKMYWTDYIDDVVRRANLDGTGVEDLYVVGSNLNPGAITLDPAAGKVYWAQDSSLNRDVIMRMNLDGTDPETIAGTFGLINALCFVPEPTPLVLLVLATGWLRRR
jgi:DNA-binding beta-propeller fold protein YncE